MLAQNPFAAMGGGVSLLTVVVEIKVKSGILNSTKELVESPATTALAVVGKFQVKLAVA